MTFVVNIPILLLYRFSVFVFLLMYKSFISTFIKVLICNDFRGFNRTHLYKPLLLKARAKFDVAKDNLFYCDIIGGFVIG